MKLKVWCTTHHDKYETFEIEASGGSQGWVKYVHHHGGFWNDSLFIPWHKINCIEVLDA